MHYYTKNISDFNNATRHLSRQERSIYSDLIELQYDLETPIPNDIDWICRRVLARSEEERTDVERMLNEFFHLVDEGWSNARCEHEIAAFIDKRDKAIAAGKASGKARRRNKKPNKIIEKEQKGTDVQQTLNESGTDVELTNNHKLLSISSSENKFSDEDMRFARSMFARVSQVFPKAKEPNFEKWADTIRLVRERDGITLREAWEVFDWANKDSFWQSNIMCPQKLREQYPQLSVKMKNSKPSHVSAVEDIRSRAI